MTISGKGDDSILRITAMVLSAIIFIAGGYMGVDIKTQGLVMGFLLVIASGTDPLALLDRWKKK